MGQYHIPVNLDKKQWLDPHKLGCGLKLWEQLGSVGGTADALLVLLASSNGRGGGDLAERRIIGSWAGDRIAVVGDYSEDTDIPTQTDPPMSDVYLLCTEGVWEDITEQVRAVLESELSLQYSGTGWMTVGYNAEQ